MDDSDIAWALLQARQGVDRAHGSLEELAKSKQVNPLRKRSYKSLRNKARTLLKLLHEAEESL